MEDVVRVVVDAMGGDNAPEEIVKGAVQAVIHHENIHVILTGYREAIEKELAKYTSVSYTHLDVYKRQAFVL